MEDDKDIGEQLAEKDRRRKITIGVVVAIVVIAVIAVTTLVVKNSDPVEATELTIEGVNTELQDVISKVSSLESTTATQTETIANLELSLEEAFVVDLEQYLTDWTTELDTLSSRITVVEDLLTDWQYAVVTRAEPGYVDVQLFGAGDYAVLTTLYGTDLTGIAVRYPALYSITKTWATNTSVTVAVEPITAWAFGDLVELKLTGTLYYATALIGQGCVGSAPEW